MKEKKEKKENGFLVLIAVLVSMILLSIGLFIATTSVREIKLSSSLKESQRAFNAADTVTQCALFKEFKTGNSFISTGSPTPNHNKDNALRCNGNYFDWSNESGGEKYLGGEDGYKSVYYISLAPAGSFPNSDSDNDGGLIDKSEIDAASVDNYPYIKLTVQKPTNPISTKKTIIKAYGHNVKSGPLIVERAIETKY